MVTLARRLYDMRARNALSLAELAELTGLDISALSSYECGLCDPSLVVLRRLANLYGISLAELLAGVE